MEVRTRGYPVNLESGKINVSYDKLFGYHAEFGMQNLNNGLNKYRGHPLNEPKNSIIISRDEGDYIQFTHSDLATDSGQTALPLWDAQSVAPVTAVPLKGFGFHWKSVGKSGGFVAPTVIPHEYENYNDLDFREIEAKVREFEPQMISNLKRLKLIR